MKLAVPVLLFLLICSSPVLAKPECSHVAPKTTFQVPAQNKLPLFLTYKRKQYQVPQQKADSLVKARLVNNLTYIKSSVAKPIYGEIASYGAVHLELKLEPREWRKLIKQLKEFVNE